MAKRAILGSVALGSVVNGVLSSLDLGINVLDALMAVSGSLFTATAIGGSTIAANVSWLDQELLTTLTLFFGALYIVHLLGEAWDRFNTEVDDND